MKKKIYIKYFSNLEEGEPGVLISGEEKTIELLKESFKELFCQNEKVINISNLPFVKPINNIQLIATLDNENKGIKKVSTRKYIWELTSSKWFEFAEMLSALKEYPSHQYFNIDSDELLIKISNGEYTINWIGWCE